MAKQHEISDGILSNVSVDNTLILMVNRVNAIDAEEEDTDQIYR